MSEEECLHQMLFVCGWEELQGCGMCGKSGVEIARQYRAEVRALKSEVEQLRERLTTATRLIAEWVDIDNEPAAIAMHREATAFIESEKVAKRAEGKA